jgi:hypothetical protein
MKNEKSKKAQTITEFTILLSIMMLLFVIFFIISENKILSVQKQNNKDTLKQFGNIVSTEIRLAEEVHNNYHRTFYLPETLNGDTYNIELIITTPDLKSGSELVINYSQESYIFFYDALINGSIKKGENTISKHNNIIRIN